MQNENTTQNEIFIQIQKDLNPKHDIWSDDL